VQHQSAQNDLSQKENQIQNFIVKLKQKQRVTKTGNTIQRINNFENGIIK